MVQPQDEMEFQQRIQNSGQKFDHSIRRSAFGWLVSGGVFVCATLSLAILSALWFRPAGTALGPPYYIASLGALVVSLCAIVWGISQIVRQD